jgi:hypothetical protein
MSEATRASLQLLVNTSARARRDRLEILTALLAAPGVEPVYHEPVLHWPGDHPVYGWFCRVNGCRATRTNTVDLCHPHRAEWRAAKQEPGATRREFLRTVRSMVPRRSVRISANSRTCPAAVSSSGQRVRTSLRPARFSSLSAVGWRVSQPVTCRTVGGSGGAWGGEARRLAMWARTIW